MSDNEEGFFSMSELRLKHRTLKEQKRRTESFGLTTTTSTPRVNRLNSNTSKSFIASTPKRNPSIIPSRKRTIEQFTSRTLASTTFLYNNPDASLNQSGFYNLSNSAYKTTTKLQPGFEGSILSPEVSFISKPCLETSLYQDGQQKINPFKKKSTSSSEASNTIYCSSHQVFAPVSRNPFKYIGSASTREEYFNKEKPKKEELSLVLEKIKNTLKKEYYQTELISVQEQTYSSSGSASESEDLVKVFSEQSDSDDSFNNITFKFKKQKGSSFKIYDTTNKLTNKEEKVNKKENRLNLFLDSYKPTSLGPEFTVSLQVPFEFSLKEELSFVSPFPLDFIFDETIEASKTYALTHALPKTHEFDFNFNHSPNRILTKCYSALLYHVHPHQPIPLFLARKFSEVLNKRKLKVKLNLEEEEAYQHFLTCETNWRESFKNVFYSCMENIASYFYYVGSDFAVIFLSSRSTEILTGPKTKIGKIPVAFLHGATPGLVRMMKKKGLKFTTSALKTNSKFQFPTNGLSKEHLTKVRKALNPPKECQLVFSGVNEVTHLYTFLLNLEAPNQEIKCQSFPRLISPTGFLHSQAQLPTITIKGPSKNSNAVTILNNDHHNVKEFKYEIFVQGLILPSAQKSLFRIIVDSQKAEFLKSPSSYLVSRQEGPLIENEPPNDFLLKIKLKPNLDTMGLAGRWMFPLITFSDQTDAFDVEDGKPDSDHSSPLITPTLLTNVYYGVSRFRWY